MKNRFARRWEKWDAAIAEGRRPEDVIETLTDEALLELLASGGEDRAYETDILAVAVQNRLARQRRKARDATKKVTRMLQEIRGAVEEAALPTHQAEGLIEKLSREPPKETPNRATDVAHQASRRLEDVREITRDVDEAVDQLEDLKEELHENAEHAGRESDAAEDAADAREV